MTNSSLSLVAALLDRSGSMHSIADDTRGGFDAFIASERGQDGRTVVTLAQFDDEYELVYENRPIEDVPNLVLQPRHSTALHDALGQLITDVGASLSAQPEGERPGSVTVLVMMDGHENASREWTGSAVKSLIEQQESQYNWDFVFLGANMDAVETGRRLGFKDDKSMTYATTFVGVSAAFSAVADYQGRKRSRRAPRRWLASPTATVGELGEPRLAVPNATGVEPEEQTLQVNSKYSLAQSRRTRDVIGNWGCGLLGATKRGARSA